MELKHLLAIFRKDASLYGAIVLSLVVLGLIWHASQPLRFRADLLLNVGRTAGPAPTEYAYDSFYRLQADERFGETVVRWLANPRVAEDIFAEAGLARPSALTGYFTARRLSSQVIEVNFVSPEKDTIPVLAAATVTVLNRYAESLNPAEQEDKWFRVIGSEPVLSDARIPQLHVFLISLAAALFIGFWTVLIKYYFKDDAHRD